PRAVDYGCTRCYFLDNSAPSQPHVDRNCFGHDATWPNAVAKSWPAVDPEGRDARAVSQSENVQFLCRARGQGARSLAPVAFVDPQRDSQHRPPQKATPAAGMANAARTP